MPPGPRELALDEQSDMTRGSSLPFEPLGRLLALWGTGAAWPLLPAAYLGLLLLLHGDVRGEHVALAVVALVLGLVGRRGAAFYRELLPLVVMAIGYDCVRYARAAFVGPERVLGCGLRALDRRLVSVSGLALPEWFTSHHAPWVDLLAAVPYAAFVYVAVGSAVWLWFRDRPRMRRFLWAFALANALSFMTWIALPAAPPWYLAAHGCAIDVTVPPNPAGLARVDALLGFEYFGGFYARGASVFGALPSMHCAYPLLGLLTSWRVSSPGFRALHVAYAAWMASAAVYLGHHWAIDVVAGWLTAAAGVLAADLLLRGQAETLPLAAARGAK